MNGYPRDYFMMAGIICVCAILIVAIPINYHPWRYQVFIGCFGRSNFSQKENFAITGLFMTFCCLVAIGFPNITSVLSILGGLCSCTMAYLIPTLAYVKLNTQPWYSCKNLPPILFFGTLTTIGYISVVGTVYLLATGSKTGIIGHRSDLIPI